MGEGRQGGGVREGEEMGKCEAGASWREAGYLPESSSSANLLTSLFFFAAFRGRGKGRVDRLQDGCTVFHHTCALEELAGLLPQDVSCSAGS